VPTWGQVLKEFQESGRERGPKGPDGDAIRLKYLQQLRTLTKRAVISYQSSWLTSGLSDAALTVEGADVHGMMEMVSGVQEKQLDLILHSPGGDPQAAEQMMEYLRTKFDHIRAIVPLQAKSAATMMALGCDEILLGDHSELGPIDPQIFVPVPEGQRFAPAHAIIRDFRRAQQECKDDVTLLAAWTPILRSYAGGLIEFCIQQINLSMDIVAGWLERYMLRHPDANVPEDQRKTKARAIAEYFGSDSSYEHFRSHSRPVRAAELRTLGLRIRRLEDDRRLQDAVLSIYHATNITFTGGPFAKIIENHNGKRYVRVVQTIQVAMGPPQPPTPPAKPRRRWWPFGKRS
jgi:hypothetical protein